MLCLLQSGLLCWACKAKETMMGSKVLPLQAPCRSIHTRGRSCNGKEATKDVVAILQILTCNAYSVGRILLFVEAITVWI